MTDLENFRPEAKSDIGLIGAATRRQWLAPGIGPAILAAAQAYAGSRFPDLLVPLLTVDPAMLAGWHAADDADHLAEAEESLRRRLGGPDHGAPWTALWTARDGRPPASSAPEWIGHHVLGPVLAAWGDHAAARMMAAPELHALALHRDGAVLGEALRRHTPTLANRVGDAWLSRRSTAVAAIADAADREGLANLLLRMRHRPATAAEAAAELGLPCPANDADTLLTGDHFERFCDQVATPDLSARLDRHVEDARHRLLAHLDSLHLPDDAPLLLLDVGYAATVQRCLSRVLMLAGRRRAVHGLYLVTSPGALWAMAAGGSVHGMLGMLGAPEPFAPTFLRHRDVVECLLAQPAGELLGYDAAGRPRCADSVLPLPQIAAAGLLQAAALDFVADWARLPPLPPEDSAALARLVLTRLFLHPLPIEVDLLGDWHHADTTSLDGLRRLAKGPASATAPREETLWPAAALHRHHRVV